MSGSGGSGYSGGFEAVDACDTLVIETQLSSPKENVIEKINVGNVLDVALMETASTTVVVILFHGETAGGIAAPQVQKLRDCIMQGTIYDATVISKDGGQVRVRIKPKH